MYYTKPHYNYFIFLVVKSASREANKDYRSLNDRLVLPINHSTRQSCVCEHTLSTKACRNNAKCM